jgi:hypothetical protein
MILSRRRDLICQKVVELVTDYLEGSLSRADRRRFERHLKGCPNCTNALCGGPVARSGTGIHRTVPAMARRGQ